MLILRVEDGSKYKDTEDRVSSRVGQIYIASSFKCCQDSWIARIDRVSSEIFVSKCNTRTKQIFHPRQFRRFFVARRITRIGKNSMWPSHVPFIRAFNRQPWNRFFFFFFFFVLSEHGSLANFPSLCFVTTIKFGIQKYMIIFNLWNTHRRSYDPPKNNERIENKDWNRCSFVPYYAITEISQNFMEWYVDSVSRLRIYLRVKESSPNSPCILRQSRFRWRQLPLFVFENVHEFYRGILTRFCPIIIFSCYYFFFFPLDTMRIRKHLSIDEWKRMASKLLGRIYDRFIESRLSNYWEDHWLKYKYRFHETLRSLSKGPHGNFTFLVATYY